MTDDTTTKALAGPAALLRRSVHARLTAAARQSVALGLARAGAAEFTRISTGDFAHGFPGGSDYGALCEQDDLTKAQAEIIFREAGRAVRAEAQHMAEGAGPEPSTVIAAVIAAQLAEWEAGAALEWAHVRETRERIDREEAEMNARKAADAAPKADEAPAPRLYLGRPLTPGMEYVETWLGGMKGDFPGGEWLAQNIDAGFFAACPRCHFLHPARPAWDLGHGAGAPERTDACDVCAHVPDAAAFGFHHEDLRGLLDTAAGDLEEAREARAAGLYALWMGGSLAADLWLWAEMAQVLRRVEEAAKRGEKKVTGGGR